MGLECKTNIKAHFAPVGISRRCARLSYVAFVVLRYAGSTPPSLGAPAHAFKLHLVQCRISPPPHRCCSYAHILKARLLSLDASRRNSSFARVRFVLCGKLFACHIRTSHTKGSLALKQCNRTSFRASLAKKTANAKALKP